MGSDCISEMGCIYPAGKGTTACPACVCMPYEAAKISGLFDKIIVSTDSQKIVYTAKEYSPDDWETAEAMYEVAKKRGFL